MKMINRKREVDVARHCFIVVTYWNVSFLGDPKANEAAKVFKHVPENCRLSGLLENEDMGIKDQGSKIRKKMN